MMPRSVFRPLRLLSCVATALPLAACCLGPDDFCPFPPARLGAQAAPDTTVAPMVPRDSLTQVPKPIVRERNDDGGDSSGGYGGGY
jgi:hypothetical protein